MNARITPAPARSDLDAFWMPFTANRQFKANPRLLTRAEGMHYWTTDGRQVIDAVAGLPDNATIVCGWVLPRIRLALAGDQEGPHQFIYLVEDLGDYQHYLLLGRQLYYLPGVDLYESQAHDLELSNLGARELAVAHERQRAESTGE